MPLDLMITSHDVITSSNNFQNASIHIQFVMDAICCRCSVSFCGKSAPDKSNAGLATAIILSPFEAITFNFASSLHSKGNFLLFSNEVS